MKTQTKTETKTEIKTFTKIENDATKYTHLCVTIFEMDTTHVMSTSIPIAFTHTNAFTNAFTNTNATSQE